MHCNFCSTEGLSKSTNISLRPKEKTKAGHILPCFSGRWGAAFLHRPGGAERRSPRPRPGAAGGRLRPVSGQRRTPQDRQEEGEHGEDLPSAPEDDRTGHRPQDGDPPAHGSAPSSHAQTLGEDAPSPLPPTHGLGWGRIRGMRLSGQVQASVSMKRTRWEHGLVQSLAPAR